MEFAQKWRVKATQMWNEMSCEIRHSEKRHSDVEVNVFLEKANDFQFFNSF